MADGVLEVTGKINLVQFWPGGSADADTSKVLVKVNANSFRFQKDAASQFRVTHAFEGAAVVGRVRKDTINKKGEITVRLQGVDAPELHYAPPSELSDKPKNGTKKRTAAQKKKYLELREDYRQPLAETATVALATFLGGQSGTIDCVVRSYVDKPNDAFDTYGRFVGEIFIPKGNGEQSINRWLLRNGWAVPTFYSSMAEAEILPLIDAANAAYEVDAGIWPTLDWTVGAFNFKRIYRKNGPIAADAGEVLPPKIFRRHAAYAVNKEAGMVKGTFHAYLQSKNEGCFTLDDHLEQGPAATERQLHEFIKSNGAIEFWPEELVFKDAKSRLMKDGELVTDW